MLLPAMILLRSTVTPSTVVSVPPLSLYLTSMLPPSVPTFTRSKEIFVTFSLWPLAGVTPKARVELPVADDTVVVAVKVVNAGS